MKEKHVAIIDSMGRNVIGKLVKEDETTLTLHNPVILYVQPEQNGQLQVQSFPVFFFEFISKEHRDQNNWTYTKSSIVRSDVILDDRILSQYERINKPQQDNAVEKNNKVISIDDL